VDELTGYCNSVVFCLHVLQKVSVLRMALAMTVTVRLSAEEERRLETLAQRTGRTKSYYVRQAIQAHLEDLEDAYAGDEALRNFEESGGRSRPISELLTELGLGEAEISQGRAINDAADR
jgi:RHH-type rel operon transcriptional repressor/antitoxin RelB